MQCGVSYQKKFARVNQSASADWLQSEKAEKVVKNLPKAINAVKGTVVKDSAAMKSVTTISNAITTYAKSSGGMTTATIKAMSKHLKMYTKKETTTEA